MPYYDEGESSSSESTTPEQVKVTEWLILGANLQELNLELADFTSKCPHVTPILSCMQTKPGAFQLDVSSTLLLISVFKFFRSYPSKNG